MDRLLILLIFLTPSLFFGVGVVLGQWIIMRRLGADLRGEQRPQLRLGMHDCRVVTAREFLYVKHTGVLEDLA